MTNQTITFSGQSCLLTYDHWWRSCAHEHAHTLCTRPHLNSNNNENAVLVSLCIRRFFYLLFICVRNHLKKNLCRTIEALKHTHTSNIIIHTHETHFVFTYAHINVIFKCFICSTQRTHLYTRCVLNPKIITECMQCKHNKRRHQKHTTTTETPHSHGQIRAPLTRNSMKICQILAWRLPVSESNSILYFWFLEVKLDGSHGVFSCCSQFWKWILWMFQVWFGTPALDHLENRNLELSLQLAIVKLLGIHFSAPTLSEPWAHQIPTSIKPKHIAILLIFFTSMRIWLESHPNHLDKIESFRSNRAEFLISTPTIFRFESSSEVGRRRSSFGIKDSDEHAKHIRCRPQFHRSQFVSGAR